MPCRFGFDNHRVCYCKLNLGSTVPKMDFSWHFSEEEHHGFLEDMIVKIIDRLTGKDRIHESFWQLSSWKFLCLFIYHYLHTISLQLFN